MVLNAHPQEQPDLPQACGDLSKLQRQQRWFCLGLTAAPLLGAMVYRYGYRVPFLQCPLRAFTGIPCPTCGMTRSFVAIAQGDLSQAIHYHWFGPLLFLGFIVAALHILSELFRNQRVSNFCLKELAKPSLQMAGIGVYFGYYGYRMTHWIESGELLSSFLHSPMGVLVTQFML